VWITNRHAYHDVQLSAGGIDPTAAVTET
jgi:hypothetical protein